MAEIDVAMQKPFRHGPKPGDRRHDLKTPRAGPMVVASMPHPYAMAPPMHFWPADAMYVQGLTELILNQVHYYFSPENLVRDQYLRQHMDGEGWIPIGFAALVENASSLLTENLPGPSEGLGLAYAPQSAAQASCKLAVELSPQLPSGRFPTSTSRLHCLFQPHPDADVGPSAAHAGAGVLAAARGA